LRHWFSWFLFCMCFLSPFSLTCSMLFFYNMIYATCFIFFLCKFFNDLHFSYLKFLIAISPCLLIFWRPRCSSEGGAGSLEELVSDDANVSLCMRDKTHSLFFVYHSPSTMFLKVFLVLLVFYSSIWTLFDFFF
jgi:hypothetical protein